MTSIEADTDHFAQMRNKLQNDFLDEEFRRRFVEAFFLREGQHNLHACLIKEQTLRIQQLRDDPSKFFNDEDLCDFDAGETSFDMDEDHFEIKSGSREALIWRRPDSHIEWEFNPITGGDVLLTSDIRNAGFEIQQDGRRIRRSQKDVMKMVHPLFQDLPPSSRQDLSLLLTVEPLLGDNYPRVLRERKKMKKQHEETSSEGWGCSHVLYVGHFQSSVTTWAQLLEVGPALASPDRDPF